MKWDLQGGVAVITGAASGIGRALAQRLAQEGMSLALADVDAAGLAETAALLAAAKNSVSTHIVNVADIQAMEQFSADVAQRHERVTLLVNNAGVGLLGTFEEISLEEFDWLMRINFWGVVYGVKFFLPLLRQESRAHIVNVSSMFGLVATGNSAYCASKFALRGFTEALQRELQGSSVQVLCALPGRVNTPISARSRIAAGMRNRAEFEATRQDPQAPTSPETAASRIVQAIKQGKSRILIGADAVLMDRLQRASPANYAQILNALKKFRG